VLGSTHKQAFVKIHLLRNGASSYQPAESIVWNAEVTQKLWCTLHFGTRASTKTHNY